MSDLRSNAELIITSRIPIEEATQTPEFTSQPVAQAQSVPNHTIETTEAEDSLIMVKTPVLDINLEVNKTPVSEEEVLTDGNQLL